MYKVFFNDSFLMIAGHDEPVNPGISEVKDFNQIETWLAETERSLLPKNIVYRSADIKKDWETFVSKFKIIEAAGGLVQNSKNQYLLIFRRGKWDLPKGKIEKGETIENAAIREVIEETGLQNVELKKLIFQTYHIYRLKDKLALKLTHWFLMKNFGNEKLVPQTEEDIEKAEWLSASEVKAILQLTYLSIQEILMNTGILK